MIRRLILSLAILVCGSALAEARPKPAPTASAAVPAWAVDKSKSRIGWRVSVMGQQVDGTFQRYDADIRFDPKRLTASEATISIDVASAASGSADRDTLLPSEDWFNAKAFPRATFRTRSFKDLGGGRYQALGDLTVRGVTRPVALPFTLAITGDTARMSGVAAIDRSVFGVGQGQFKGPETVGHAVQVMVTIVAARR